MKQRFLEHYKNVEEEAVIRIKSFQKLKKATNKELFEEMTFCVFAANSSAEMGLLAVDLLKDVLLKGSLEDYKEKVRGKVRFYNKRAEYLFHNRKKLKELNIDLKTLMNREESVFNKRLFVRDNFKGFGLKESSHFLRNTGHKGICIIDKHVLNVMKELKILKEKDYPKKDEDYFCIENKIKKFAKQNGLDIDVLDLAMWSFKTGKIIK